MTAFLLHRPQPIPAMFLPVDTLSLSDASLTWAIEQSQTATTETDQWQMFLNALARAGIEQWLEKRSPELLNHQTEIDRTHVCHLTIGNFRLYLVATDSLEDDEILFSQSAIQNHFDPHFYVLVQVFEELQQIRVRGYLAQTQLMQILQSSRPVLNQESYWLPITGFDLNPDRLLLYLRCLEPTAIEAAAPAASPAPFTTAAINVGLWLQNQIDRLAEELSWVLLPPLTLSSSLRGSIAEELELVLNDVVRQSQIHIPSEARAAYQDIDLANLPLRLYAATWQLPGAIPEWSLLIVLGTQPGTRLPVGIHLQVRDATQVLEDAILQDDRYPYLYACVFGNLNEQFWVTMSLPNGAATTLPPFTFNRDAVA